MIFITGSKVTRVLELLFNLLQRSDITSENAPEFAVFRTILKHQLVEPTGETFREIANVLLKPLLQSFVLTPGQSNAAETIEVYVTHRTFVSRFCVRLVCKWISSCMFFQTCTRSSLKKH